MPGGFPFYKWWTIQHAMVASDVSPRAIVLLTRLVDHHNHLTGQCNPTEGTLAAALNCTTRTVRKGLRELEKAGLLVTRRGTECPPRNYYVIKFYKGDKTEYRKAEKTCLQRRKKSSGKSENEPKKYLQRKKEVLKNTRLALGMNHQPHQASASNIAGFQSLLVEKLGGGEVGWNQLMKLDPSLIENAFRKTDGRPESLHAAANGLLKQIDNAAKADLNEEE